MPYRCHLQSLRDLSVFQTMSFALVDHRLLFACRCSSMLCLHTVCPVTLNPSLVFNARRCHSFFYWAQLKMSSSHTILIPRVEFVLVLNFLKKEKRHCEHMHLPFEMMERLKCLLWLHRQHRKWMFKAFAKHNTAGHKMVQLKGNFTSSDVVKRH